MTVVWWDGRGSTQRETMTVLRDAILSVRDVYDEPHPQGVSHKVAWGHNVFMSQPFLDEAEAARVKAALSNP